MHSTCILTCSIRGNFKRIQKLFHFKSFHSWCIWPLCWIKLHSASCSHDCILLHARAFLHSRSFKCIIAWLHSPSVNSYNMLLHSVAFYCILLHPIAFYCIRGANCILLHSIAFCCILLRYRPRPTSHAHEMHMNASWMHADAYIRKCMYLQQVSRMQRIAPCVANVCICTTWGMRLTRNALEYIWMRRVLNDLWKMVRV